MSFDPQATAWLEENAKSWTLSSQKVHSEAILAELKRLNDEIETHVTERTKLEEVRKKERREHLVLDEELRRTKEEVERIRDAAATEQTALEGRLEGLKEKLSLAETMLKDTHYALLKQPELKREEIADVITSVVTPYPEGEKP